MNEHYGQDDQTRRGIKRLIWIVVGIVFVVWAAMGGCDGLKGYERGDRIKMDGSKFAARSYDYYRELGHNVVHEDEVAILQMMYDGNVRMVSAGTKGKVIMEMGDMVEVKFDDSPFNWWVSKDNITKLN